jgi:hypothetical protein
MNNFANRALARRMEVIAGLAILVGAVNGQAQNSPNVSQVLMYSATQPNLTVPSSTGAGSFNLARSVPSIFTETVSPASLTDSTFAVVLNGAN